MYIANNRLMYCERSMYIYVNFFYTIFLKNNEMSCTMHVEFTKSRVCDEIQGKLHVLCDTGVPIPAMVVINLHRSGIFLKE